MLGRSPILHGRPLPTMGLIGLHLVHSRCPLHRLKPIEGGRWLVEGLMILAHLPHRARSSLGIAPVHPPVPGMCTGPDLAPVIHHVRGCQMAQPIFRSTCVPRDHVPLSLWLLEHAFTCQMQIEGSSGDDREVRALAHRHDHSHQCLITTGHQPHHVVLRVKISSGYNLAALCT